MKKLKEDAPRDEKQTAMEVFEALLSVEDEEQRRFATLVEVREAQHKAQQERYRRDVMATWSPGKVRALIEVGKLTAEDVRLWKEAREQLDARNKARLMVGLLSAMNVRLVK